MLDQNINVVNLKNLPSAAQLFIVDSVVNVSARMGPGFNYPGGVATVVSRKSVDGETVYTVSYTLDRSGENDLPATLLSSHTETTGRRSSSSSSSSLAAAALSSDARRAIVNQMTKELAVERWQAQQDRQEAAALKDKMKGFVKGLYVAATSAKAAAMHNADLQFQHQTCLEEVHRNMDQIAAEAAAANDGSSKMAAKLQVKAIDAALGDRINKVKIRLGDLIWEHRARWTGGRVGSVRSMGVRSRVVVMGEFVRCVVLLRPTGRCYTSEGAGSHQ